MNTTIPPYGDDLSQFYPKPDRVYASVLEKVGFCRSLLDYGCRTGQLYSKFCQWGLQPDHYHGVDQSEERVAVCKRTYPHASWFLSEIPHHVYECVVALGIIAFSPEFLVTLSKFRTVSKEKIVFDYVRDDLAPVSYPLQTHNRNEIFLLFHTARHVDFQLVPDSECCELVFVEF